MADATPPSDSDKPAPLPSTPTLVLLPHNSGPVPPDAQVVRLVVENSPPPSEPSRWIVWLVRLLLLGGVGTIVGVVFWVLQLRAQVESIDAKIDARVAAKSDDIRKEVFAESKTVKEDLDLLNRVIEFERGFREMICQGAYEQAIQEYFTTLNYLRPKELPDALKPAIYRLFIEAVVKSGRYGVIKEDDLDRMDSVLRKDLVSCGAGTIDRIAILYATMGKFDKARTVSASVVTVFAADRDGRFVQDGVVAPLYATLLLIELCQQKGDDPEAATQAAWQLLTELEQKRLVRTDAINASFDLPELSAAFTHILLRQSGLTREGVAKLRQKLRQKEFVRKHIKVKTATGWRDMEVTEEADVKNPPKDPPKVFLPEDC